MKRSPLRINVLTDTHYYSKENGISGQAYEFASLKSQKLLAESTEVLQSAFDMIAKDESDILLISGDLTNNGELNSHKEFISMLRDLKSKGKRIYVITATHDFRKGGVTDGFKGDEKYKVYAATRDLLFDMYREFGPDEALAVHMPSMSYVVQLEEGYRLFALNDDTNLSGKSGFSDECFEWIKNQAEIARDENQFIIAMTHHPLIAPSPIYEIIGKGDMLGDYDKRIRQLADLGIQFVFTGHTHIQNISAFQSEQGNVLYDVCTASPIGYPGTVRTAVFDPENSVAHMGSVYVETPDSFVKAGKNLREVFENQLVGFIKAMIDVAGKDLDKLAQMATAMSIKPKVIYKYGWIIKPLFKFLNSLKIGTVAKWVKRESGLKKSDYKEIKDVKVVDFISELVLNLYGGESKYPPDTPQYRITMGLLSFIDSVLRVLHIDLKKITKVSSSASELVESLLYNHKIDSYNTELKIFPFIVNSEENYEKLSYASYDKTVKKSRKGLPFVISVFVMFILFLPLWLILILFGFVKNKIKYGKKMK